MLQQTQVKTVLPRYLEWFEVFPDIQTLAAAHLDDVLKQWEGLGYYRRARFIHAAALEIVATYHGVFPQQFEDMLKLKGIGRSTAGAISSFCFQTPTPVLDGNVKRVLSAWANQVYTDKELWLVAQHWIEQTSTPDMWNQAMMELGATHCQAKKRECSLCPVSKSCQSAFSEPLKSKSKVKVQHVFWQVDLHQNNEFGIWLKQRPEQGIWAGLWTPPITILEEKPDAEPDLVHLLTHRKIHLYINTNDALPQGQGRWVTSWEGFAIPTGIHRLFENRLSTRA
ncbi:MAG: NUDIX domain-containing protein [Ghiorsea sp.]